MHSSGFRIPFAGPGIARKALLCMGCVVTALALAGSAKGSPMKDTDLPLHETNDAVMASTTEIRQVTDWVSAAFLGQRPVAAIPVQVRRQDFALMQWNRSCIDTPLRIGSQAFRHGIGTHAVSEIVVGVPEGARAFRAMVGIDNNDSTGGCRGSVRFAVDVNGAQAAQTGVRTGGMEPEPIEIKLPAGANELVLHVDNGGDGPSCDQADWAEARFVMADGREIRLDENQINLLPSADSVPFSFLYGGQPSASLLSTWKRDTTIRKLADRTVRTITWTDPRTALKVTAEVTTFAKYAAVDWVVYLENAGAADTPVISEIQALDTMLRTGFEQRAVEIHQLHGDSCGADSFRAFTSTLEAGKSYRMAPTGGRPSSISAFPWFDVEFAGRGFLATVGWTGQWAASFDRSVKGPTTLRAGMELTHLVLHPGERIRTPRILLLPFDGDRTRAHNQIRRLVLHHYMPHPNGRVPRMPLAIQTFDRYFSRPGWATESGQIAYARAAKDLGMDSVWLDAAWFPRAFPTGVGTWSTDPKLFPNGLRPVADECHKLGLKFILWFEPERVAADTEISNEHPEFVFGGAGGGLFRLDNPAARRWLTDLLVKRVREWDLDVYRNDFNMDPLPSWRENDTPDRQGITEIRYVEGLYAMWDEIRASKPGIFIDNCSSGGRRLDLEMMMRSVPLWRSDTGCSPGHPEWNQMQSVTVGSYIPLFTIGLWSAEPYEARSTATCGAPCEWSYLDGNFNKRLTAATVHEIDELRPYWYGDMYAIASGGPETDRFAAFQLHRPDLNAGVVLAFRRKDCDLVGIIAGLRGLKPSTNYRVELIPDSRKTTVITRTGRELMAGLELRIAGKPGSLLARYTAITASAPAKRR